MLRLIERMLVGRREINGPMEEKNEATFNVFPGATQCKFAIFSDNNALAAGEPAVDLWERLLRV